MWLVAVLTVPEKVVKAAHYRGQDSRYQGGSSGERQICHPAFCGTGCGAGLLSIRT